MSLFTELKRRNVFRVAVAYLVTCWLVAQIADIVLDTIEAPSWVMKSFLLVIALGLPLALILAWAFEITSEGIKLERHVVREESISKATGRKLDYTIIVLLSMALGYFIWESRFQPDPTVAILAKEEAGVEIARPLSEDKSVAVLPFVNLSSDPEQEYFSDGISEDLLNVLAQFPHLRVAARTSSFQFKDDNRNVGEIAKILKVGHILEGSVRKSGNRLRITAQLIDASSGYHLWSQTYDRELEDVFAIQDEISAAIGEALKLVLQLPQQDPLDLPRVPETSVPGAYVAFLKARQLINRRGNKAITEARQLLQRAIRLDPAFAPAHAHLAIAITLLNNTPGAYGNLTLAEINKLAPSHIERALALDPDLPEGHGAQTILELTRGNFQKSLIHADRALLLNPAYTDVINWKYNALEFLGRYSESVEMTRKLLTVDPLSVAGQMNISANYLAHNDIDEARKIATRLIGQHAWAGYTALGSIALTSGDYAQSLEWMLRAYGESPYDRLSNEFIVTILATVGLTEEARRVSDDTLFTTEFLSGNYVAAEAEAARVVASNPADPESQYALSTAQYFQRKYDDAQAILIEQEIREAGGVMRWPYGSMLTMIRHAYLHQTSGEENEALQALTEVTSDLAEKREAYGVRAADLGEAARAAAIRGNDSAVFELLAEAFEHGDLDPNTLREPLFDDYHQQEAWAALELDYKIRVTEQRLAVLDLICNQNPIPNYWQPLAQTCIHQTTENEPVGRSL